MCGIIWKCHGCFGKIWNTERRFSLTNQTCLVQPTEYSMSEAQCKSKWRDISWYGGCVHNCKGKNSPVGQPQSWEVVTRDQKEHGSWDPVLLSSSSSLTWADPYQPAPHKPSNDSDNKSGNSPPNDKGLLRVCWWEEFRTSS